MDENACREEYTRRIHRVQNYIEKHLDKSLTLDELSSEAGFSKYHFSRIFQAQRHESLARYVNRIRMEEAAFLLAHREDLKITEVALETGFTDSAVFARGFHNFYGVSPREYRKDYRKNCKESFLLSNYNKDTAERKQQEDSLKASMTSFVKGQVEIVTMEAKQVAYVRHTGTYEELAEEYVKLMNHLFEQAGQQGLLGEEEPTVLAIYHDNPEFGEQSQFRTSLCLVVPDSHVIQETGMVGRMVLEGGQYAVGHFQIQQEEYGAAWNYMYQEWLSGSHYVPRNSYPFEVYRNNPQEDENHMSLVDIYVPIEPFVF